MDTGSDRKEVPTVGLEEARKDLGSLAHRAGVDGEHFIVTSNGRPLAAIVGLRDFDRLRQLDASAAAA